MEHNPESSRTRINGNIPQQRTTSGDTLEVLIAYTPKVLSKVGSEKALHDEIGRIIAYANAAHRNSGSSVSFSVVKILPLATDAEDNFSFDLQAATFQDGIWDELTTVREEVGADLVSVLVDGSQRGTLCGLAWTNGIASSFEENFDYMYSVVSISGTCTRDTFVHEVGHNLGSAHARVDRSSSGSQPYSFGYRFKGGSGQGWHTIMAVPGTDRLIPFFSTPELQYDSVPLGVADSEDNVRSMATSAPIVSTLGTTKGLPNLTAVAPPEVSKISVKYSKGRGRRTVTIASTLSAGKTKLAFQPVEIYFSQGRKGVFKLRAAGRTDSKGAFTLHENITFPAGYFYRACYPGYRSQQLCSAPTDLTKVSATSSR